ncbi:hypothetical protein ACT2FY_32260 [Paraburkholderia fungorum]|uniref:hypothetical protein n=1 Tax=Paraburkholderia fungorum TaxID=134537 RepID=UPI00402BB3E3
MSNESVQQHLATESGHLLQTPVVTIALAPALDKTDDCANPKTPTFVRPRLEYIEYFEKHTRAACNAAQVYSFLVFRCQRNKPGDVSARLEVIREGGRWGERAFWYLHTAEDIAVECYGDRKAKHKVQSALDILKRLKLIEAQRGRHPINGEVVRYRGKSVLHIRLGVCQRGNGLDAWPTTEQISQMRIIPVLAGADTSVLAGADTLVQDALEDLDAEEGNTQSVTSASAVTTGDDPVKPETASGKIKTSKKPEASAPFLDRCLSRKRGWLKEATNSDNPAGCLLPDLTDADRDIAQRLEYRLTKAGLDALAFMDWLTPFRFQQIALGQWDAADYAFLWIGKTKHQQLLIAEYRQYLADQQAQADKAAAAHAEYEQWRAEVEAEKEVRMRKIAREQQYPDYLESKMSAEYQAQMAIYRAEYWPEEAANQPATPLADLDVNKDKADAVKPVTEAVAEAPATVLTDVDDERREATPDEIRAWFKSQMEKAKAAAAKPKPKVTADSNFQWKPKTKMAA